MSGCIDRPFPVLAGDGKPRTPVEDQGAPYGVVVKAGKAATLKFGGATIEVPAGAVDHDVRLTVRPLPVEQVHTMDLGMINVTPGAQAFRFGPHGMTFKKPVRIALPFDRKAIGTGYTPNDVRTFYFDEGTRKWEQVGFLAQTDGAAASVTEHFTDFINATITMPDHPGTQSLNPTSMKDIKVANPGAGISLIEAPSPSSSGNAQVSYPIEVPPGRRGVQPHLAVTYNSDAGNGWLGVGWDLHMSSIEIDTRFGVPRYRANDTVRYLLDGALLVSSDGINYRRRVEGQYDLIKRVAP